MLTVSMPEEANLPQAERAIASAKLRFRFVESTATWEPSSRQDVHIDLSDVRFIHLSALAEVAIAALETLPLDGGLIRVSMPRDRPARRFIVSADFLPALRLCPYREGVRVQSDEVSPPESFDQLFPLRWIDNSHKAQFDDWLEHVFGLSSKRTIGLITDDAEALSRLILDELVDNVVRHSGRSHALVSAWTQRRPRSISSAGYLPTEGVC